MRIYLADLKKEQGNYVSYHYLVDSKTVKLEGTGFSLEEPVTLQVSAAFNDRDLFIKVNFKTRLKAVCSRCLVEFSMPLEGDFQEKFNNQKNSEDQEMDSVESFFQGDAFDLKALLREMLILSLPLKPLCSSRCRGLCPECGSNLNLEDCSCEVTDVDPRLEDLKKFFEK